MCRSPLTASIKPASSPSPGFTAINWSTASPIGRSEARCGCGREAVRVRGYINTTFNPTSRSDVYDPVNNTWARITDLPKPLSHVGTAVDGKDIYLAGGYVGKPTGGQIFYPRRLEITWTRRPGPPCSHCRRHAGLGSGVGTSPLRRRGYQSCR